MKQKINLYGESIKHCLSTNGYNLPKKVEWVLNNSSKYSIYIDKDMFRNVDNSKINFGMLTESATIIPGVYKHLINNIEYFEKKFELIFTHSEDLINLNISKKIRLIPPAYTPWIQEKDRKLYKKTKLVSMIASKKSMCDFHILRNNLAKKYENNLDLFGRGRKEIVNKIDGLKDYMFSIAIENANYDGMISEKLTDCFATGTVPVYLGSEKTVKKIFDANGVIFLNEKFNIENLNQNLYNNMIKHIEKNFEITKNLQFPEDYIYENFIRDYDEKNRN